MKRKNIFNKALALALVREGHDILSMVQNREHDYLYLFSFEDTKEFRQSLTALTKERLDADAATTELISKIYIDSKNKKAAAKLNEE